MRRPRCFVLLSGLLLCGLLLAACGGSGPATPMGATALPAGTRPSGDASSHLEAAQAAAEKNDAALAEQEYKNALALDPKLARAQFGLGNVYVRQNRLAEAETAFKAALALDPTMLSAHANLGVVYYQMGQLAKAADEFSAALKIDPKDAQTLYLLGAVRLQQNDLPGAEEVLIKARDLKPDLPEVYYGLGVLYKQKGQKAEAIAAFKKFLEIGPGQDPAATDNAKKELQSLEGQ